MVYSKSDIVTAFSSSITATNTAHPDLMRSVAFVVVVLLLNAVTMSLLEDGIVPVVSRER
jgi:hypothetical protein